MPLSCSVICRRNYDKMYIIPLENPKPSLDCMICSQIDRREEKIQLGKDLVVSFISHCCQYFGGKTFVRTLKMLQICTELWFRQEKITVWLVPGYMLMLFILRVYPPCYEKILDRLRPRFFPAKIFCQTNSQNYILPPLLNAKLIRIGPLWNELSD